MEKFQSLMIDKVGPEGLQNLIVTTSCGVGSLQPEHAKKAMELLKTFG
ncbi:MAG: hypothetical protein BWX92_03468 [Deltaproteobacteria bacterium ADurb.Bin135]|nr:MAG: hypothetical protein BWX92_03468 [Deltaproteobacteria bacterium ADurb.Bin135]